MKGINDADTLQAQSHTEAHAGHQRPSEALEIEVQAKDTKM
jgi:hypothetical protein